MAYGAISREVEDLDEMAFFGGGDLIRSRRIFMATLNALEAVDCVNIDIECLNTTYTTRKITVTMGKVKFLGGYIYVCIEKLPLS